MISFFTGLKNHEGPGQKRSAVHLFWLNIVQIVAIACAVLKCAGPLGYIPGRPTLSKEF